MNHIYFRKLYFTFVILFILHYAANAQKGPGGVSHESTEAGTFYSNIVWLNASTIKTGDGGNVPIWDDIAPEPVDNSPKQSTLILQPFIRKDISASINGKPILQFGDGRKLLFSSNNNFNNKYVENRTTFMVFRTSGDINTMQIVYEEGGNVRGLNVYIYQGELYFGGYDQVKDADNTPKWPDNSMTDNNKEEYAYTKAPIKPYTTYIVSHIFHGEKGNNLDKGYITGYINGVAMPDSANRIGCLGKHPDTPGLGAVNGNTIVHTTGVINGSSNPLSFLGDYAEFIVYDLLLNNAERTIVENYLASKYFANSFDNDYFEHKVNFGNDVIGIGKADNGDLHNLSQGQNPFIIKANPAELQNGEFFILGHNNKAVDSYLSSGTPGVNTIKLKREWRVDHTGDLGAINFRLDKTKIPAPPEPNYTKYVLLIDKSGGNQSDFSNINTEVVELVQNGSLLEADVEIPDNAFLTIGLIEPTVFFPELQGFGFEKDVNTTANFTVALNYIPSSVVTVEFNFKEIGEATETSDFIVPANKIVQFNALQKTVDISFDIVGDLNTTEPEEKFVIELVDNANLTAGISINENNSHTFSIYDNDHTPNIQFANTTESFSEGNSNSVKKISVVRDGDLDVEVFVDYDLSIIGTVPTEGTATSGDDYSINSGTLHFNIGETTKYIDLNVVGDEFYESDETVILQLSNIVNANLNNDKYLDTITIANDDFIPNVEFKLSTDENPEIIGRPEIEIIADKETAFDIVIDYEISGLSTATNGVDYSLATTGSVIIPAGETRTIIPIINTNDAENYETPETIIINLTGVNAYGKLKDGGITTHTYTIIDYISFEWDGVAGVGKEYDNLFWLNASGISGSPNSSISTTNDDSPNNLTFKQTTSSRRAIIKVGSEGINNRNVLKFDGVDDFYYDNFSDSRVNKSGTNYKNRTIIAVFETGNDVGSRQIIFEQGKDNVSGIVIGFEGSKLVGQVWGNSWGGTSTPVYIESASGTIQINKKYIVSLNYFYNSSSENGLALYLNGNLVGEITNSSQIGEIEGNNNNLCIGGTTEDTRFKNSKDVKNNVYFEGNIAEIIYYGSDRINKARFKIVENYLAAKYNIDFTNTANKLYSFEDTHSFDVIGIGTDLDDNHHLDSKGKGIIRIKNPTQANTGKFLFIGHNNNSFNMLKNVPEGFNSRINRTWRIDKSGGDLGAITLIVDASNFSTNDGHDLEILIDNDEDFSNARKISSTKEYDNLNEVITFTDIDLKDGEYFTFALKINKWTGQVSKNWTNPSNWNGNIPASGNTVIIPTKPAGNNFPETMTETTFSIRNLIFEPAARAIVPAGKTLNISGNLIFEHVRENQEHGMLLDQGTVNVSGQTIVQKYMYKNRWHYISIPLENVSSNILTENGYNPNLITYVEDYDGPDTENWDDYAYAWNFLQLKNQPGVTLERGVGHAFYNNRSLTYDIAGDYNSSDVNIPISNTPNDVTKTDGWNFLGNPFTCSINWDNINSASKAHVDNTVYYWTVDPVSGEEIYSYYNGTGGGENPIAGIQVNGGSKYILPNQGFFVHAKSTVSSEMFTINREAREFYSNESIKSNNTKSLSPNFLKLAAVSDNVSDETVLRIISDASSEHDSRYDAYKKFSTSSKKLQIYTVTEGNTDLAINSIPEFDETLEIPLAYYSPKAGNYKIIVAEFEFGEEYIVSVLDNNTGSMKRLSKNDEFYFDAEAGFNTNRFKLVIDNSAEATTIETEIDNELDFYVHNRQLYISSEYLNEDLELEIYSVSGKLVYRTEITNNSVKLDIADGLYIAKLRNKTSIRQKKIFIK